MNSRANGFYYSIILLEIILAFVAGVFGNKVSELINITPSTLLVGTGTIIIVSLIITVIRINYESNSRIAVFPLIERLFFRRVVTIFPVALILGLIIGYISSSFISRGPSDAIIIWAGRGPWLYEVVIFFVSFVLLILLGLRLKNRSLMLTFCFGLSLGISGSLTLAQPFENNFWWSLIWWLLTITIIGFFATGHTGEGIVDDFKNITKDIGKEIKPN
jgi:hypothetical protein